MPKVYEITKIIVCKLMDEYCFYEDLSENPPCERCDKYIEWKKSGMTIKDFTKRK